MANRFVRVSPKIDYLGYDDFMKPLRYLQEAHNKQKTQIEAEEDAILTQLGMLNATKGDSGYTGVDSEEANVLQNYLDSLKNISNKLASQGIKDSTVAKDARELWRDAIPTLKSYELGIKNRDERQKEISALERQGYRVYNPLSSVSDYANMDESSLTYYNPEEYIKAGAEYAKQYNSKMPVSYDVQDSDVPGYKILITNQGLSEIPTSGAVYNELYNNAKNHVATMSGLDVNNYDQWDTMHKDMVNTYMQGLSEGIIPPEYKLVADPYKAKEREDISDAIQVEQYNTLKNNSEGKHPFSSLPNYGIVYKDKYNNVYNGEVASKTEKTNLLLKEANTIVNMLDKNNIEDYLSEDGKKYYEEHKNDDDFSLTKMIIQFSNNIDYYMNSEFKDIYNNNIAKLKTLNDFVKSKDHALVINSDGSYTVYDRSFGSVDSMEKNLIAGSTDAQIYRDSSGNITNAYFEMDNNFSNWLNDNIKNNPKASKEIINRYNKLVDPNNTNKNRITENNIIIHKDANTGKFKLEIRGSVNLEELNNVMRSIKNKDYLN